MSKNLLKLEEQLGVRLVQRSTRTLRLTDEGNGFLDKARAALRALDQAIADVSRSADTPAGVVRISVGASFGRRWVLPALPVLTERYRHLRIDVDLENRPVDLVAEGYDIGIRGAATENSALVARHVCKLPLALVASPAYLRRAGVPTGPADLASHRCIQLQLPDCALSRWSFRNTGGRLLHVTPEAAIVVNDTEAAIELALADAGVAQAGLYQVLPYLRSGRLKIVLGDMHDPGRLAFVLLYPHRQYLAPRVRVVADELLAHFRGASDLHQEPADLAPAFRAMPKGAGR